MPATTTKTISTAAPLKLSTRGSHPVDKSVSHSRGPGRGLGGGSLGPQPWPAGSAEVGFSWQRPGPGGGSPHPTRSQLATSSRTSSGRPQGPSTGPLPRAFRAGRTPQRWRFGGGG